MCAGVCVCMCICVCACVCLCALTRVIAIIGVIVRDYLNTYVYKTYLTSIYNSIQINNQSQHNHLLNTTSLSRGYQ